MKSNNQGSIIEFLSSGPYTPLSNPNRLTVFVFACPLSRGDRLVQNAEGDYEKAGVCMGEIYIYIHSNSGR